MASTNGFSSNVSALQLARQLIPNFEPFEEFLLWPPDLFAFTSVVLSVTGAYNLCVSPPVVAESAANEYSWPPENWPPLEELTNDRGEIYAEIAPDDDWQTRVNAIGRHWRRLLCENFDPQTLEDVKKLQSWPMKNASGRGKKRRRETIERIVGATFDRSTGQPPRPPDSPETPALWLPHAVLCQWFTMCSAIDDEYDGNVYEIFCGEAPAHGDTEANSSEHKFDLEKNWKAFKALMTLHAIADDTCAGLGIRHIDLSPRPNPTVATTTEKGPETQPPATPQRKSEATATNSERRVRPEDHSAGESNGDCSAEDGVPSSSSAASPKLGSAPETYARKRLRLYGTLSSINTQRCRILPKRHTPEVGVTLRSFSNSVSFHRSSVEVRWDVADVENSFTRRVSNSKMFSVLLLPWPLHVSALDFSGYPANKKSGGRHLFSYKQKEKWLDVGTLMQALDGALTETSEIDMVVLPECALSRHSVPIFEEVISRKKYGVSSYVAGVATPPGEPGSETYGDNMVYFKMGTATSKGTIRFEEIEPEHIQFKHHPWKLEQYQIKNYSLGHVLSPHDEWWEAIRIRRRKVTFINIGDELTVCPLICEDLARQDPIADLIRTVGPSLVITILMDGPQRMDRWSAKYASVLSEDPGSAVITLTSFGMLDRWRPEHREPSRVVALWNDGNGSAREIELAEGSIGILLTLSIKNYHEKTMDGRTETYPTNRITLGGIFQVRGKPRACRGAE